MNPATLDDISDKELHEAITFADLKEEAEEEEEEESITKNEEYQEQAGTSLYLETIDDFVSLIAHRARKGYDSLTAITGEKNSGKSHLAQQIIIRLNNKLATYNMARDTIFADGTAADIETNIKSKPLKRGIVLDEAVKWFYRMDWRNVDQNELIKFITFARIYGKHLFLCIPYFTELRSSFRNEYIFFWIQILKQGFAVVFIKDFSYFEDDKWHIKGNRKLWSKISKGTNVMNPDQQLSILQKTVNYIGDFPFTPLPDDLAAEYLDNKLNALSDKGKEEELTPRQKRYKIALIKAIDVLYNKHDYTQQAISKRIGIPVSSIAALMRDAGIRKVDKIPEILARGEI